MDFKCYPEEKYTNMMNVVDPYHYQVAYCHDPLAQEIYPSLRKPFIAACISTGGFIQVALNVGNFEIPKGSRIAHMRLYREAVPLSKSYDTVIFPIRSGAIISVQWKHADDHHRSLLTTDLEGIVEAHRLPSKKSGHVSEFTENGAIIPVVIDFGKQEKKS